MPPIGVGGSVVLAAKEAIAWLSLLMSVAVGSWTYTLQNLSCAGDKNGSGRNGRDEVK
jgi:hypothetical protein